MDCRLKQTSPTAYCDCWERCSCRALLVGNQTQRERLLIAMMDKMAEDAATGETAAPKTAESLMLFLARTLLRQSNEQKEHRVGSRPPRSTTMLASNGTGAIMRISDMRGIDQVAAAKGECDVFET